MTGKEMALAMVLSLKDKMSGEMDKPTSKLTALGHAAANVGKIAAGVAVAGVAALAAGLAICVKAAAEEEQGIARLGAAVKATGANWEGASKDIEKYLAVELQRTALDDGIGRESIAELTTITGDYRKALELMPLAQDLARAKGMDLASASQLVGRVAAGNTGILTRYGIVLEKGATATQAIAEMQKKFGGQAEAYGNTYAGQMEKLNISFGNIKETIGAALLPMLTKLAGTFAATLSSPALQAAIANIAAGLSDVVNAIATLITKGDVSSFFELLTNGLYGMGEALGIPAPFLDALSERLASLSSIISVQVAPAIASITSGLSDIVNGIILLITQGDTSSFFELLTNGLYGIGEALGIPGPLLDQLSEALAELSTLVSTQVGPTITDLSTVFSTAWTAITSTVQTAITLLSGLFNTIAINALPALKAAFIDVFNIITITIRTAVTNAEIILRGLAPIIQQALGTTIGWVQANWPRIQAIFQTVWNAVRDIIMTVMTQVVPKIQAGLAQVLAWVNENWPRIERIFNTVMGAVLKVVEAVIGAVVPFIREQFGGVIAWVTENWPLIQQTIETVLNAVLAIVETVLAAISTFWEGHGATVMKIVGLAWDTIKTIVSTAINTLLGIIKAIMQAITGDWKGAWLTIQGVLSGIWDAILTIVTNKLNMILAIFGTSLDDVIKAAGDKVSSFVSVGRDLVMGMVKGVLNSVGALIDSVVQAIKDAIAAAKAALGAGSPSRVFAEMGVGMMEGLAQGIERGAGKPAQALQQLFLAPAMGLVTQFAGIINQLVSLFWELGAEERLGQVQMVMDTIKGIADTIMAAIDAAATLAGASANLEQLAVEMTTLFSSLRGAMLVIINETRWFDPQDVDQAQKLVTVYQGIVGPLKEAFVITKEFKGVTVDAAALGKTAVAFFGAMDVVVKAIRDAAERMGVEGLGAANAFAVTVAAVVGVIGSGVMALTALAEYKGATNLSSLADRFATDLVSAATAMVEALEKVTDLKPFEAASAWATAIGPAVAIIKPAIDALVALAEYKPVTGIAAKMKTIADQIGTAILEFARVTTWRETMKPWETAGVWATAVTSAVGLVKGVVDALTALGEYKPVTSIAAKMTTIANQIGTAILEFARVSLWRETMKPWEAASTWATAVASAVGLIKGVVDALTALGAYKPVVGIAAKMTTIADQIGTAILEFARVVAWRETMKPWETAGEWATKIGPAVNLIKGAVDALAALAAYKPVENLVEKAALFATQLADALDQMIEGIEVIGRSIESWTKASAWATAVGPAVSLIKGAVDALASLAQYKPVENLVEKAALFATQLADALDQMIEGIEVIGRKIEEWKALGAWATAIGPALTIFKSAVDGLIALAEYKPVTGLDTLATNMFNILGKVLYEMDYAIKHWSKYVQDWTATSTWATAVRPALDAIKSMVDAMLALATYVEPADMAARITAFVASLSLALSQIATTAVTKGPEIWAAAGVFATNVFPAVALMKAGLEALDALADFGTEYITPEKIDVFVDIIRYCVEMIAWLSYQVAPVAVQAAAAFATQTQAVWQSMKDALAFLGDLNVAALPNEEKVNAFVATLTRLLNALGTALGTSADIAATTGAIAANLTNAGNIDIPPLVPGSLPHPMPNLDWTGIIGRPRTTTGGGAGGGGAGGGGATLSDRVYDILVEIRDILAEELALGSSRTTLATREAILDAMGPIVSESLRRQARRGVAA